MGDDRFAATLQVGPGRWLSFHDPALVLQADSPDAVSRTLTDVEHLTRDRGLHAVGFVTYEAAAAFGLPAGLPWPGLPAAWFALYHPAHVQPVGRPQGPSTYSLGPLTPSIDRGGFDRAFGRIREHLAAGDSYQANFTFNLSGPFTGDAFSFFADLSDAQRGEYSAYIDLGDLAICSASPELFFEFRGTDIIARPMKGTAPRGRTLDEDRAAGLTLGASTKERAENVMVVDMIRNDLGRVAEVGSVEVAALFDVERYPNVWQMTSTVKARSMAPLADVFAALHPSASVTGAPKRRTLEILRELEAAPRGIYTGAIGHVPPDGLARFNVAIRTALIDRRAGLLWFGIGSGIVWDSDAAAEFAECLLKASVLGRKVVPFDLLETFRWTPPDGYFLFDRHMARLSASAEYFDVRFSSADVHDALSTAVVGASEPQRVRLLVSREGAVRVEQQAHLPQDRLPLVLSLAAGPVDPDDVFLYHKTTNRIVYERARTASPSGDDVLLWNQNGEVTEATTANVVVELDGTRVTPPVSCGLLPGTCRAAMLAEGTIVERTVRIDDLRRASRIWLINAVHGERAAILETVRS